MQLWVALFKKVLEGHEAAHLRSVALYVVSMYRALGHAQALTHCSTEPTT
jgi:hypothetical protein